MQLRSARAGALFTVVILVCTGGCSANGSGGVEPKKWALAVCSALTPWRAEIADLTARAQAQLQAAKTASQTKSNIVDLLAGAETSSEKARSGVTGAGSPDVEGGDHLAQQFADSLTKARDAYGNAKRTVSALPTTDAKGFYNSVGSAFVVLKDEYEKSAIDLEHVGQKDLQQAFNEVPECR